jgi:hypothetical protein
VLLQFENSVAEMRKGTASQVAEKRKNVVIPKRSEEPAFICVLKRKRVPPPGEDAGRSE